METPTTFTPTVHIVLPKKKEEFQTNILEIAMHQKGIKTNIQLMDQKEVKQSNNNLELFIGIWKPFKPFAQQYEEYGIHIGYSGQRAWVCDTTSVSTEDLQTFKDELSGMIESLNKQIGLNLDKDQAPRTGLDVITDALCNTLNSLNPGLHLLNAIGSIWDEDDKGNSYGKSYLERFKKNTVEMFTTKSINSAAKYLFGNLLFIQRYLDEYLKENSIQFVKKDQ